MTKCKRSDLYNTSCEFRMKLLDSIKNALWQLSSVPPAVEGELAWQFQWWDRPFSLSKCQTLQGFIGKMCDSVSPFISQCYSVGTEQLISFLCGREMKTWVWD